jgi:hypothetical protein
MTDGKQQISIWFFIGVLLTIYGVLILGVSIVNMATGTEPHVVLSNLHAGVWWGALLLVIGVVYLVQFAPNRHK